MSRVEVEMATGEDRALSRVDASILIVAWNAGRFIKDCLATVKAGTGSLAAEIIVVDNASSDGTGDMVREGFGDVRLIRTPTNLGFAKGNNFGLPYCTGKYIYLVNPDVTVHPECIPALFRYMELHPDVGIVGPRLLNPDGTPGRSTMRFPTLWRMFCRAVAIDSLFKRSRVFGGFLMRDFRPNQPVDVDILNGWFWVVRREALQEVGVLDRRLFMYGDDMDWCYRFRQAGWRAVLYPLAEATHYGGGTTLRAPVRFAVEKERSFVQYWEKYHGKASTLFYRAISIFNHFIRLMGYTVVAGLPHQGRPIAVLKRRRSMACLLWLAGLESTEGEVKDERVG
jgi:hypothetical protein